MDIGNWLTLAGIVVGFVGGIVIVVLSDMQVFQVYPNFEVKVGSHNDQNSLQKLLIENVGPIQAKKSTVYVLSDSTISMKGQSCLELTHSSNMDENTFRIDFERMSTNIRCDIDFISINGKIFAVAITSDDSPGRLYFATTKKEEDKPLNMTMITFEDPKQREHYFYNLSMIGVGGEIAATAVGFAAYQWSRKRRLKELKFEEKELRESLERYQHEFSSLYEKFVVQKEVPIRLTNRLVSLHERISDQSRKLDEIRSMKKTVKKLDDELRQFFEKWEIFENTIIIIAGKEKIDVSGDPTILPAINEMKGKVKLDPEFFKDAESLVKYRNKLAHGLDKPTKNEIRGYSSKLNKLTKILEEYLEKRDKQ